MRRTVLRISYKGNLWIVGGPEGSSPQVAYAGGTLIPDATLGMSDEESCVWRARCVMVAEGL